jgi:hypothetical protein
MVGSPFAGGEHRLEILGIEVAIIDLVAGGNQRIHGAAVQRRLEAAFYRMGVNHQKPHFHRRASMKFDNNYIAGSNPS